MPGNEHEKVGWLQHSHVFMAAILKGSHLSFSMDEYNPRYCPFITREADRFHTSSTIMKYHQSRNTKEIKRNPLSGLIPDGI